MAVAEVVAAAVPYAWHSARAVVHEHVAAFGSPAGVSQVLAQRALAAVHANETIVGVLHRSLAVASGNTTNSSVDTPARCMAIYCPTATHDSRVVFQFLVFFACTLVAMVIQAAVLSRTRWKFRHLPYWVANLQWQPATMFSMLASPAVLLTMAVVFLPFIVALSFAVWVPTLVSPFYANLRSPVMLGFALGSMMTCVMAFYMALNQFKASQWHLSTTAKTWFTIAFVSMYSTFAAYYTVAYIGIPWSQSGVSFAGIATVFLTLNLWPLTVIQFDNSGSGMPIDYAIFLKSKHVYNPDSFVVRVAGAGEALVDGVYKEVPEELSDNVAIYRSVEHYNITMRRVRYEAHANESFWAIIHDDGKAPDLGTHRDAEGRILYAMRSELNGPPGGVWQAVCDGEVAAEPAPAVIIEDKFIHELEALAVADAAKGQKWKQKKIAMLYGLAGVFALGLWMYTWFVVQDTNNIIGYVVMMELTWIEIAQTMQLFAGVKLHPLLVVLFQYLSRVAIVGFGQKYWFLGSCVIYLLFAAPVAFAIVDARYPILDSREMLRQELLSVLPRWMYSHTDGGAASQGEGASFMHQKVLANLLLNPIMSVTAIFNCEGVVSETDHQSAARKAAMRNAWAVFWYLTVTFGACTYFAFAWRGTAYVPSLAPFSSVRHEQYEFGVVAVALSITFVLYLTFLWTYSFYGHTLNAWPHTNVILWGIVFFVVACGSVAVVAKITASDIVLAVGLCAPVVSTVGVWGYKNWQLNDFLILRSKRPRVSVKARHAVRSIRNLLPDLSCVQLRKDGGCLFALAVQVVAFSLMGYYLSIHLHHPYSGWFGALGMMCALFTFLMFKAWFNTFHFPWYPFFAWVIVMAMTGVVFHDNHLEMAYFWAFIVVYPLLMFQVAAVYQWWDNDWRLSWKETPFVLVSVIGIHVITTIVVIVGLLVLNVLLEAVVKSSSSHHSIKDADAKDAADAVIIVIAYTYFLYLWTVMVTVCWSMNDFRMPKALKVVSVVLVLGYVGYLIFATVAFNLVSISFIVKVVLGFILLGLVGTAVSGLRSAAGSTLLHTSPALLPVKRLNTATQMMDSANEGTLALLASLVLAILWSILSTLTSPPAETDALSTLVFSFCVTALTTFLLYKTHVPQQQYFEAWAQMKQFPKKLYTLRDQVQKAEGIGMGVDSNAGASKGTTSGKELRKRARSRSQSRNASTDGDEERKGVEAGAGADTGDVVVAVASDATEDMFGAVTTVRTMEKYASEVPAEFPSLVPCIPKRLEKLTLLDKKDDPRKPKPYYIVAGIEKVLCGVYVHKDDYSDDLPVYFLTGAAVPTWLKRIKVGTARYWVIGQSNGFQYAARVDCLKALQARKAEEARQLREAEMKRQSKRHTRKHSNKIAHVLSGGAEALTGLGDTALDVGKAVTGGFTDGLAKLGRLVSILDDEEVMTPELYAMRPPRKPTSWCPVGDNAGEHRPVVKGPVLETWEDFRVASSALVSFYHSISILRREEARLLARFQLSIVIASAEQAERERLVLWTFILRFLSKKGDEVELGNIDQPKGAQGKQGKKKKKTRSVTSLSPHEMSKWVRHIFAELRHRAKLYARSEARRRQQQRLQRQIDEERSRRRKLQLMRDLKPQFGEWETAIDKIPCPEETRDKHYINAVDRVIGDQLDSQRISRDPRITGWQDPLNPRDPTRPNLPYVRPSDMAFETGRRRVSLFIGGADARDIKQGMLGDCWLLSAMSVLASGKEGTNRVRQVIVHADLNKGYYVIKLYRAATGSWHRFVVDDFFPCGEDNTPLFGHCADPETWVMVMEKGYAKFCQAPSQGYQALDAGLIHEGLVAFTGGASEEIELHDDKSEPVNVLWKRLLKYHREGYLMGAGSPPGEDSMTEAQNGIVQGHAYGILRLEEVTISGTDYHMILVRNPWGDNPPASATPLDWFPTSPMWNRRGGEYMKRKLDYNPESPTNDKGEFWMKFEDFHQQFATVFVCRLLREWNTPAQVSGNWYGGSRGFAGGLCTSATGHNNPQFLVTVRRTTVAFFTLSQTGQSREEFHGIMAVLFPGSSPRRMPLTASETSSGSFYHTGAPSNQREVSREIPKLPSGTYVFIPFTFYPNKEAGFTARFYTPPSVPEGTITIEPLWPAAETKADTATQGSGASSQPPRAGGARADKATPHTPLVPQGAGSSTALPSPARSTSEGSHASNKSYSSFDAVSQPRAARRGGRGANGAGTGAGAGAGAGARRSSRRGGVGGRQ